jgi:hypothetical protein
MGMTPQSVSYDLKAIPLAVALHRQGTPIRRSNKGKMLLKEVHLNNLDHTSIYTPKPSQTKILAILAPNLV